MSIIQGPVYNTTTPTKAIDWVSLLFSCQNYFYNIGIADPIHLTAKAFWESLQWFRLGESVVSQYALDVGWQSNPAHHCGYIDFTT